MKMANGQTKRKCGKAVLPGLLVMLVLAGSAAGCDVRVSAEASSGDPGPFITDRVVEVRIVMKEEDWTACRENAREEQYVRADFWFDGELVPDVGVRPKGNSSLRSAVDSGSPRFSLKVDFNLFNSARTFRGVKKLNLNNGFSDPTFIRERLAYELFEQMGIPTPRACFVDLWVNDTHLGLYTQVEQVDKAFLGRHFAHDDGNLYKPEMPAASLDWTEAELSEQQAGRETAGQDDSQSTPDINIGGGKLEEILQALEQEEPSSGASDGPKTPDMPVAGRRPPGMAREQQGGYLEMMGLKTNENRADHSALFRFLGVLNNEPDETFPQEIEKVLDVDETLRFLAVSSLIVHLDNYLGSGHNYYLYEVDGRFTVIPWDLNMAFGTFNCGIGREGLINSCIDEPTCEPLAERPLVDRLLSHPPYLERYHDYLEALLEGPFSPGVMESRIDEMADLIRPVVTKDELKFFSTEGFERGLGQDVERSRRPSGGAPTAPAQRWTMPGSVSIGLKAFVTERGASVRQQLEGKRPSKGDGSGNAVGGSWAGGMPGRQPGAFAPGGGQNAGGEGQ